MTLKKFLSAKKTPFLVFGAISCAILAPKENIKHIFADTPPTQNINIKSVGSSPVSQNMLDGNDAVISNAKCSAVSGINNSLTATYTNLPVSLTSNKVIAVLVDEYMAPGTAYKSKFLDASGSVTFENIDSAVKLPQIHLYKQSPNDPDFLLRGENFIAKNSIIMPYVKQLDSNGGFTYQNVLEALDGNGNRIDGSLTAAGQAQLITTTVPNLYCLQIPLSYFSMLNQSWANITSDQIFGIFWAEDSSGHILDNIKTSVVCTRSGGVSFGKFYFTLPENVFDFQFHIYKDKLIKENFLLKYKVTISKSEATQYSLMT